MKNFNLWFILSLIAIFAMTCASQWNITHEYSTQSNTLYTDEPTEHDTIKLADIVSYTDRDGVMHFDTNKTKELHGFTGDSIIHYYSYLFDVGEHNEWRLKHTIYKERESFGNYTTYIYEAYHKGYSTNKNVFYFDVKNEQIFRGKEISVVDDLDVDTTVIITSNEAKKNAVNDVHGNKRIWQIRMSKKLIEKDNKYNLVYAAVIWTLSPYNQYEVLIDTKNGDILDNYSLHKNCGGGHLIPNLCSTPGTQNTSLDILYYQQPGQPTLPPTSSSSSQNSIVSTCGSDKVLVDAVDGIKLVNTTIANPFQFYGWNSTQDCAANTFYWVGKNTKNYYKNKGVNLPFIYLNMMGYTNNGSSGTIPPDTTNGYPQGYSINLGLGSPSTGTNPLFTYDIVGHEFMHAVDKFSVNIAASNSYDFEERFILYEGMCDIMGITIESKYKQNDWIIGNDANYPDIRNLQNPHFSNSMNGYDIINFIPTFGSQPKIYQEPSKWISPTTLPSGTVTDLSGNTVNLDQRSRTAYAHHNNGVLNYWFYLLAEGNPNPLGVDIASNIAFLTWKDEFVSYGDKNFHSFRDATLKVTHEKYDCNTWETVRQAWDAVGVTASTCEIAVKITTTCPSPSTCSANITTCGGSATGTRIKISGGGLAAPIKISATQHNATNLVCGNTYTVEVTDKNNPAECVIIKNFTCQANTTGSINLPCPPSTIMTASYNGITNCNGNDITGSVTGGILPYTYNWSNGSTSQNLTNVPSGTYGLTVSDDGCSNYQESFNVNGLVPLNVSGQIIHSACNSMPPPPHHPPTTNDGSSINITVSGGLSPYTYSWSNGVTTQNVSNLTPNAYTVTVTDGNGCTKVQTFSIGAPEPNILNVSIFNACPIANDGEIINVTIGGTPPYSYQWSGPGNSQTVESPIGVASGTHYVTVTDANGCTDIATRFVAPAPSSWVYDYENCEKVYTCHGNSYSEDMLDYANIINIDEEDCTGEINCLIVGGTPSPMSGNISYYVDWGFLNNNPHCEQDCYMNGSLVGTVDAPSTISSYMILSTEINSCDGDYYDIYCDGQLTGYYCDEEDIAISILIGMNPNWEPAPPLPTDTIHLTGPMARVTNGGNLSGLEDDEISIFPNPFDDYINLTFESNFEIVNIKLLNIMGQEVESKILHINKGTQNIRMDFEQELARGIYLIQLEFPDGSIYTQKLIKQ